MSYVALATDRYDEVVAFYGEQLGFPVIESWDRDDARGLRFDIGAMKLEVLDNARKRRPLALGPGGGDRIHIVVEVDDVEEAWWRIGIKAPGPETASWGARLFQLRDPDGVAITFLQWLRPGGVLPRIRGRIARGSGKGTHFTGLDWARKQFVERLGIDPFPGTLNLSVEEPEAIAAWIRLCGTPGIRIDNPHDGPRDCSARCYRVRLDGRIDAAIVLPEADGYPEGKLELIAPIGLRDALGKGEGDEVSLEVTEGSEAR
jgi:catechol 2,3-dioxygenase-like lactoylglutathione lyase family enzyme